MAIWDPHKKIKETPNKVFSRPPLGFQVVIKNGAKVLDIDIEKMRIVKFIRDGVGGTKGYAAVSDSVFEEFGVEINPSQVKYISKNPIYSGDRRYGDELYPLDDELVKKIKVVLQ